MSGPEINMFGFRAIGFNRRPDTPLCSPGGCVVAVAMSTFSPVGHRAGASCATFSRVVGAELVVSVPVLLGFAFSVLHGACRSGPLRRECGSELLLDAPAFVSRALAAAV